LKYLLDTDTVSFALRGIGRVGEQLLARAPKDVAVSSITESELWYGVHRVGSPRLRRSVEAFLAAMAVLPFDSAAARDYGDLRAQLEKRGAAIGVLDTLIAAHARTLRLCLVTSNTKHFVRLPRLKVEDWK
jgi:tRNA(fMet)-specific endonuclease VapC